MSFPSPIDVCSVDSDCPRGYRCEDGICVPDDYGGGSPIDPLPGLANYLIRRYTSNIAITEQMAVMDLFYDVIFVACRGYFRQSASGRLGMKIKRPVPYGFATAAVAIGDTTIALDNVKDWIGKTGLLLIAPHVDTSEVHSVTGAVYPTSQNSVTVSSTGGLFTTTNFSGCDGASTPATATITVNSATAATACSITIDGKEFGFTTSSADTTASIAEYIGGLVRIHPALNRKYEVSVVSNVVHLTARFGTLTLATAMLHAHTAPLANPTTAPTLAASGSSSDLAAGTYSVGYSVTNDVGETLLSKFKRITITDGQTITVSSVTLPTGATGLNWYISPEADSPLLRYFGSTDGAGFTIDTLLPTTDGSLPPDLNRTGVECVKISAVFSDRSEPRTSLSGANVLKATYSWLLGNRNKTINVIALKYRDKSQDWRLITRKFKDRTHIEKVKKELPEEVNGQAINNEDQALRIGLGLLAEKQDADFFYKWKSHRDPDGSQVALLLQEGDVVATTDSGSGLYNFPVMIEEIDYDCSTQLPVPEFTGRKYSSRLYDDSLVEAVISLVISGAGGGTGIDPGIDPGGGGTPPSLPTFTSATFSTPNVDLVFSANGGSGTIRILRSGDGGSTFSEVGTAAASATTFSDTSLTANGTYIYKLTQDGISGETGTHSVTVTGLGSGGTPPDGLSSSKTDNGDGSYTVDLSWVEHGGSGDVTIERKTLGGSYLPVDTVASGVLAYSDVIFQLGVNKTYYYRVRKDGISGYSNEVYELIPRS